MARALGEAHRKYALRINNRFDWKGHLWQERFHSFPMDEEYLLAAVRYVLLNPVRAGLADKAEDWPFSSLAANLTECGDPLVSPRPLSERVEDWGQFLGSSSSSHVENLRKHTKTGRPLGNDAFLSKVEAVVGYSVRPWQKG